MFEVHEREPAMLLKACVHTPAVTSGPLLELLYATLLTPLFNGQEGGQGREAKWWWRSDAR